MRPRPVTIYKLELVKCSKNQATFQADVSKGTYIRSLARDMGEELGCYGHIIELIRTKLANIELNDTISQEKLEIYAKSANDMQDLLHKTDSMLDDIPAWVATEEEKLALGNGIKLPPKPELDKGIYRVLDSTEQLISMVEVADKGTIKIIRNFN